MRQLFRLFPGLFAAFFLKSEKSKKQEGGRKKLQLLETLSFLIRDNVFLEYENKAAGKSRQNGQVWKNMDLPKQKGENFLFLTSIYYNKLNQTERAQIGTELAL